MPLWERKTAFHALIFIMRSLSYLNNVIFSVTLLAIPILLLVSSFSLPTLALNSYSSLISSSFPSSRPLLRTATTSPLPCRRESEEKSSYCHERTVRVTAFQLLYYSTVQCFLRFTRFCSTQFYFILFPLIVIKSHHTFLYVAGRLALTLSSYSP